MSALLSNAILFSSSHNTHNASDNHGAGNRRFMAAPPALRSWLQGWAPGAWP